MKMTTGVFYESLSHLKRQISFSSMPQTLDVSFNEDIELEHQRNHIKRNYKNISKYFLTI